MVTGTKKNIGYTEVDAYMYTKMKVIRGAQRRRVNINSNKIIISVVCILLYIL